MLMFVNIIPLLLHLNVLLLYHHIYVSCTGMYEEAPIVDLSQCTSRTLQVPVGTINGDSNWYSSVDTNTNSTDDDGLDENEDSVIFPPYCTDGYFCELSRTSINNDSDVIVGLCRACSGSSDRCLDAHNVLNNSTTSPITIGSALEMASIRECREQCGVETNSCSSMQVCPNGLFCNFENGDEDGYCQECPPHPVYCSGERNGDKNLTSKGIDNCVSMCNLQCAVEVTLKTNDSVTSTSTEIADVNGIDNTIQVSATGPIVDCGLGLEICEGVEGAVCFIERGYSPFVNKTRNCAAGGGVAAVIYNAEQNCDNIIGTFLTDEALIPAVTLTHIDGKVILKKASMMPLDSPLYVTVQVGGHDVYPVNCLHGCMEGYECLGTNMVCDWANGSFGDCETPDSRKACSTGHSNINDNELCTQYREYCDYTSVAGVDSATGKDKIRTGSCTTCPDKTGQEAFYSCYSKSEISGLGGAKECENVCVDPTGTLKKELENPPCKFCPKGTFDVIESNITSGTEEDAATPCHFCPQFIDTTSSCQSIYLYDMKFPYKINRWFGKEATCFAVAEFYRNLNIDASSTTCKTAQSFNYLCGCRDSPGYAGAHSDAKKIALVWMPRIGAILSMLGSLGIIIDVLMENKKKTVSSELLFALSCFDIIGSIGYALTSFPTPQEDSIFGSGGNKASCATQGFLIQLGTTSMYLNVSITFYYLLVVQYSWRDYMVRKKWIYRAMFAVPITIGFAFALSGIPWFDNVVLWCNVTTSYWFEVPVAIAIATATIVMAKLSWFVYQEEKASMRFRQHNVGEGESVLMKVFRKSLLYIGAFYITWVPYLILQVMLARGNAFTYYWLFLIAGTAVTLQGFWNFVIHVGFITAVKRVRESTTKRFSSSRAE